jgi:hypothetical protein
MQTVLTRYFELLKETMKMYVRLNETNGSTASNARVMLNSLEMRELYVLQFRFINDPLRSLVAKLTSVTNAEFNDTINIKVIAFVVFVIVIALAYLILWLPFVIKLTKDMWRSKSMLSIIPIEVIVRMPRIHQFLLKQSFSDIKVNGASGAAKSNKPHKGTTEDQD